MKKSLAVATVALMIGVVTGCSSGGSKPSVDELSEALSGTLNPNGELIDAEYADCVAEKYLESDLSSETLQAIVDGDEGYFDDLENPDNFAETGDELNELLNLALSTSCVA